MQNKICLINNCLSNMWEHNEKKKMKLDNKKEIKDFDR